MCGFSGIITYDPIDSQLIQKSLSVIKHRGPDNTLITDTHQMYASKDSNQYTKNNFSSINDVKSNIWLGFNRLSIVDQSENAMQPFFDKASDTIFMMNGEIYNYMELWRTHLQSEEFVSQSDSEVAFKMYLKYGEDFVDYLQGMFAIVIYRKSDKRFLIYRDRLGIKPFYYCIIEDYFIFSSEIKGIFATGLIESYPDAQGVAYSMYLGTCPSPLTIYLEIYSLRPGHKIDYGFRARKFSMKPYWTLKYEPSDKIISNEEFQEDIEKLCKLYSTGDVEKAVMLSGGIDSGTLAYFCGKTKSADKAITIYQSDNSNNELEFTIDNAKNAGLELLSFEVPSTLDEDQQEEYLAAEEEPNFIPEPTLFISKKAKLLNIRVLYNALGPDELFGGYEYYKRISGMIKYDPYLKFIPSFIFKKPKRQKFELLKEFGIAYAGFITREVFSWEEVVAYLKTKRVAIPIHPFEYIRRQVKKIYPEFDSLPILKQTSYLDIYYYISSHHTMRGDVPSMLHSIEMRFPFLEHTFVKKYFNQTHIFDQIDKTLKPMMKEYASEYLTQSVMEMPKQGFTIDASNWLGVENPFKAWYYKGLHHIFPLIKTLDAELAKKSK